MSSSSLMFRHSIHDIAFLRYSSSESSCKLNKLENKFSPPSPYWKIRSEGCWMKIYNLPHSSGSMNLASSLQVSFSPSFSHSSARNLSMCLDQCLNIYLNKLITVEIFPSFFHNNSLVSYLLSIPGSSFREWVQSQCVFCLWVGVHIQTINCLPWLAKLLWYIQNEKPFNQFCLYPCKRDFYLPYNIE